MNKLETNALRIAELIGYSLDNIDFKIASKELFTKYNGLMPIVFECNSKSPYGDIFNISIYYDSVVIYINSERDSSYYYETEPKFIEAIQLACIKYLEVKNDNSRVQQTI